jgi:simple sugar transport system ATP-binding protein
MQQEAPVAGAGPDLPRPVLRLSGITKRFGALVANDDISLTLGQGEVLALLGENGAGKSTLMSILFGHYVADAGSIEVFGQALPPGQPKAALAAGIGMVHQHFTLADNLSVLDNVMLGTEPLWWPFSRRAEARTRLLKAAGDFGLEVDPDARIGDLSVGERQRVEILKALVRGARILILDEPTAVLTPQESESLFATLSQMVAQGLSVIFISHKLDEVLRVSHRVAVLRAGRLVAQMPSAGATPAQLAEAMVGQRVVKPVRSRGTAAPAAVQADGLSSVGGRDASSLQGGPRNLQDFDKSGRSHEVVCELRDATVRGTGAWPLLDRINLGLNRGEVLAIAGVAGNGQAALAEVLCGQRPLDAGQVLLQGAPLPRGPRAVVRAGVARIPEDRHAVGVVGDLALWENAVLEQYAEPAFARAGFVLRDAARAHAQDLVTRFDVRGTEGAGLDTVTRQLSGGNMQKLILGRALGGRMPALVLANQPTWGLDVRAVAYVHQQLLDACAAGAAVLLISEDLDEILALADRIAVMHHGRLTTAEPTERWTLARIGLAMAGGAHAA